MNTTIRITGAFLLLAFFTAQTAFAQLGKISGKVYDENGAPAPSTKVILYQHDSYVTGVLTDDAGRYEFAKLEAGEYHLEVKWSDGKEYRFIAAVGSGEYRRKDLEMAVAMEDTDEKAPEHRIGTVPIVEALEPVFTVDPQQPHIITRKELVESGPHPGRIGDFIAQHAPVYQADHGDPLNFRGGRSGASATYVDGVKIHGTDAIPTAAIGQITVLTGGIPAEFGDLTSGLIIVTTYNPGMKGYPGKRPDRKTRKEERKRRKLNKKGGKGASYSPEKQSYYTFIPESNSLHSSNF